MTLTEQLAEEIIRKLLKGGDYRIEVVKLIDAEFFQFLVKFFKAIVEAKSKNENITEDWYREVFLNSKLAKDEIAINAGLNMKTISNMFNSGRRDIVIQASNEHYEQLQEVIKDLVKVEKDFDIGLSIDFKGTNVKLNINESLLATNTLAVKRAALRGGLWSTAGKRVEKPLMQTLCKLYEVSPNNYKIEIPGKELEEDEFEREIDFYLVNDGNEYKCEVKLMGQGNPESADAVIARDSKVFIADKLSETNKKQLDSLDIQWVELRNDGVKSAGDGFKKFENVLDNLDISHGKLPKNFEEKLESIFSEIFSKSAIAELSE